jgi:hypothetical protein
MYPGRNTHEVALTIRLIGAQHAIGQMVNGRLQVMMPGALITISDRTALRAVYRSWAEASVIAPKVFTGERTVYRLYKRATPHITAAVNIEGKQPGPTILGKTPEMSPSGCGQLVVKLGRLAIVCDDQAAWEHQNDGWRAACKLAADDWGGVNLASVEGLAIQQAVTRLNKHRR